MKTAKERRMYMNIIVFIVLGMIIGFAGNFWGEKYYEKRFKKELATVKNYVTAVLLCGLGGGLFYLYGYSVTTVLCYMVLTSSLLVIGHIDKKEMIIPNAILLMLLGFRTIAIVIDMLSNREMAFFIVLASVMGMFYGVVVFLLARLFGKEGIGMGDIKLFAVIGFYVGNREILWLMMASLLVAMISGLFKVAKKKLSLKDPISFGPYIATGSILIMFLGV